MSQVYFPQGSDLALISSNWSVSFDDLHRLRFLIRAEILTKSKTRPLRVIGCLRDDETALLALLFVTELFDYMPINPNLTDVEIARIVDESGADAVILSKEFLHDKRQLFPVPTILNWDDVVTVSLQLLALGRNGTNDVADMSNGRLILHTSGSTGLPKRVPISITSINASAKNIALGHNLTSSDYALNALPTFHIGALVDVLLAPLHAGGAVSITDKRAPASLAKELIKTRPTWIQIVPTILRRMVEDLEPDVIRDAGSSLGFIRSIAAPVPPDLKKKAEDLFGCPVIEMYGMTETAGQIATNARDQSGVKPGSVGKPVGVEVSIFDAYGNIVDRGKVGEVCVNGPIVFDGYEGMARDTVFFGEWFRTGDLGLLDKDGHLFLRGRLKETINVGGEKVSPYEIETAVMQMPDVIEATAYTLPHPTLGEQVGLTIATRRSLNTEQVKQFLECKLADFKRPNHIMVVEQLPRLANAKVDRLLLKRDGARALADRLKTPSDPPSTTIVHTPEAKAVTSHWIRILKCRAPEGDDDFFDMGGDSLSATELLLGLEKTLNRTISPSQLFESPTFNGLVTSLSDVSILATQDEHPALRYVRELTAGLPGQVAVNGGLMRGIGSLKHGNPLFWAGSGIIDTIGQKRPIYVTGSLHRYKNRKHSDFEVLGRQLADEIDEIQPNGPIALGGFCGGALAMHYTGERLQEMGRDIRVFLSLDYWPTRAIQFPTVHCMSRCKKSSARMNYARYDLGLDLIHPNGASVAHVDSLHSFDLVDLKPHMPMIDNFLDGTGQTNAPPPLTSAHWDMAKRLVPPQAKIKVFKAPKTYKMGSVHTLRIAVKNTSQQAWDPTELSGLSVQVDLLNLDNHLRIAAAGFASFDDKVAPGETTELTLDVIFPKKKLPLWISCQLVSQGLMRFTSKSMGARKILVLPNVFSRSLED